MKKLLLFLPLLAIISCIKKEAIINDNGCLECDNYTAGETFMIDGVKYVVADRAILEYAIAGGDDLTRYCTSQITSMDSLFLSQQSFNKDIGNWDVSNVTNMFGMFAFASSFNQDIGNWDVSNVTGMRYMFEKASSFNQDLTQWCVSQFPTMPTDFSHNSGLTTSNHPVWGTCP